MQTYTLHTDPGHGWLQVPITEVQRLGLKISSYSYRTPEFAYLEEDCDYSAWANAKRAAGEGFDVTVMHLDFDHFIREFERF